MKKPLTTLIIIALIASQAAACRNDVDTYSSDGKLSVVSTIFPYYDFVREISGGKVMNTMLLKPGAESHSYEPTPQNIIRIQNCDLFIYTGGESDTWVRRILDSLDTSKMKILKIMECVAELKVEQHEQHEQHDHNVESGYDEHVWTSPKNAALIVKVITDALCVIDQANTAVFRQNSDDYLLKLMELDAKFQAVVDNAARKTMVFADRFPFRYFADAYGLDCYAAFPGCATETEAGAATVAFLIDKIVSERIPVVYYTEFSNHKMAETICEDAGVDRMLFHSCNNVSRDDFNNGASYLSIMRENAKALEIGLE